MSDKLDFSGARVVLADQRTQLRGTLKIALNHCGMENIEHTGSLEKVAESIEQGTGPDLLICDMGLDGGNACKLLSDIRQNEVGRNPFLCVVGVTWSATSEDIENAMSSGVDYLISAPLSPQQVIDRIKALIRNRAPFVATSGYVGPERRSADRIPPNSRSMVVPNTLKEKLSGNWNAARLQRDIEISIGDLMTRKIAHQASQIVKLAALIEEQRTKQTPEKIDSAIAVLSSVVHEMDRLLTKRRYEHILELSTACVSGIEKITNGGISGGGKELQLLKELGRAIGAALFPEDDDTEIALSIAKTVSRAE
jgi:DNA-binding response OmpR family regulator